MRLASYWVIAALLFLNAAAAWAQDPCPNPQPVPSAPRIARGQESKLWELRATASPARLWGEQGGRTEARDLLAPVYGWLTEGFDTADLKDATKLLSELA